jgi:hypothetical protein
MLFDELVDFIGEMMVVHSLAAELERFYPKTTRTVTSPAVLTDEIARFGHVDRFWLLCKPPRSRKYERFCLNVGRLKRGQLEESHLGAGTDKPEAFKVLKKIAYQLKKRTTAGIWVTTCTGNVGFTKNHRISPTTADAARAGKVELTCLGFTQSFRVDPPDDWPEPLPVVQGRGRTKG